MTESTTSSVTTGSDSSTMPFIFPQHQLISVKLDESNFLIWKQQISTAIKGYRLESFIKEDTTPSPQFISKEGNTQQQVNPGFPLWHRQDQLLASCILSSLSESILILTVGLSTSKEIWLALEKNFSAQSLAKIMQYKIQLQTMKKGGLTMREYLNKMKVCFDVLASAGQKVDEKDQILHILTGLGNDYNSVMVNVTSRTEPLGLSDLFALLLSFESRLESQNTSNILLNSEGSQPSVNNVNQTTPRRMNVAFNSQPNRGSFRGQSYGNSGFRGERSNRGYRGRGGRFNGTRPVCQICHIAGHTADKCWYRNETNPTANQSLNPTQSFHRSPTLHMAQFGSASTTPSEFGNELTWYPDSGATTHVTNDLSNLNIASEYGGNSKLQMGNGAGVSISHIGSSRQGYSPQREC